MSKEKLIYKYTYLRTHISSPAVAQADLTPKKTKLILRKAMLIA
jgi:hypothetical protein